MAKRQQIATKDHPIHLLMKAHKSAIATALPKHLNADKMARLFATEFSKNPDLLKCSTKSLFGAVIQAAQLGLEPGGVMGQVWMIPYKGEIQLQIGYRGMITLALRSEKVLKIDARTVHEGDEFSYSYGLNEHCTHHPHSDGSDKLLFAYAIAKLANGEQQFTVLDRDHIDKVRKESKSGNDGPWVGHFNEMAKKTAVRALFKYLPTSVEMASAVGLDEQVDAGIDQRNAALLDGDYEIVIEEDEEKAPPPDNSGAANLKDRLDKDKPKTQAPKKTPNKEEKPKSAPAAEYTLKSIQALVNDSQDDKSLQYCLDIAKEHLSEDASTHIIDLVAIRSTKIQQGGQTANA